MRSAAWVLAPNEAQFLGAVEELADQTGWWWLHIDPAINDRGYWRTPIRGPLGAGWPDLVLLHPVKRRLIFAELKSAKGKVSPRQEEVLGILGEYGYAEVYIWKPDQWEEIVQCLAR